MDDINALASYYNERFDHHSATYLKLRHKVEELQVKVEELQSKHDAWQIKYDEMLLKIDLQLKYESIISKVDDLSVKKVTVSAVSER